ncbi:hypothetical protein K7X08_027842 [Anisodus acutangulus]|uniref:Endoglucanase n=1 Tax=Anisodus acutangulus TaxID=402998 RepID=A0A9Q1MUM9_9SOLA|nr:hypothetical protein K7X08_027842 [Anisodus acutangulus]
MRFRIFLLIQDELLWGGSWLHRALQDSSYLPYIQSNGQTMGANDDDYSFSWDDKRSGTKIVLSKDRLAFKRNIHQGAFYSKEVKAISNTFQSLNSGSPNPNVLVGAIVGGPDSRDNFEDDRNNYQQSEPATYINAPLVWALAFLSAESTA